MVLPITIVASFNVMLEFPRPESTGRVRQLEWPEEVVGLLEVGSNSEDLVDQILHTHNAIFAQVILDELIVGEGNSLFVDLAIATLVNELTNRLQVGVSIGNVRVDDGKHFLRSLCQAYEDTIVQLEKSKELHDFSGLRGNLVDTMSG